MLKHLAESITKHFAIKLAETLATGDKPVIVFRLWHSQAPVEQVAYIFPG